MECYCDYEMPEFSSSSTRTAKKHHRCDECGGHIIKGAKYEYVAGKWDGEFYTFKTCEDCFDLRQWVKNNLPCLCWSFGNMRQDCRDAIEEARYEAPEETKGLLFGFLRRDLIARKRRFELRLVQ